MGIYLFKTSLLLDLLAEFPDLDDFGGDVIPYAIKHHEVYGYDFEGYWRDIGTIRSFYETNLELARPNHPFNFYDHKQPIYTHPRVLPSSIIEDSFVVDGMIAEGCIIRKAEIRHSVIGVRSVIQTGSRIVDTIMMGSDYYDKPDEIHGIPIGVGAGSNIQGAILDKNARLGERVTIRPFPPGTDSDEFAPVVVRDGIVVVPKDVVVPAGTVIAPK
jgi:glucose-1-phosphate adenylyltransferase